MFKKNSKKSQAKTPTTTTPTSADSVLVDTQRQAQVKAPTSNGNGNGQDLAAKEDVILEKYGGWEKFVVAHKLSNDNLEDLEKADVILKDLAKGK